MEDLQTTSSQTFPVKSTIFMIVMLAVTAFQAAGCDRGLSIALTAAFVFFSTAGLPIQKLRERMSVPILCMIIYAVLNAAAGLYTTFGNIGIYDFCKIFAVFLISMLIVIHISKAEIPQFVTGISVATAVFALLSIDASSWKVLSAGYLRFMQFMGARYSPESIGYETGIRITGIFTNANILGGILALGVLLSVYLVQNAQTTPKKIGMYLVFGINALGFLLAFSMGAMLMFSVSCVVYLVLTAKNERAGVFLFMAEAVVVEFVMAFLSFLGLGKTGILSFLPILAAFLGGILLFFLQETIGRRLAEKLTAQFSRFLIVVGVFVVAAVLYLIAAFSVTTGYVLQAGETLHRGAYPQAGDYTILTTDTAKDVQVVVYSQNMAQTMMHTQTELYRGALETAQFTVPQDSKVVYFDFSAAQETALQQAVLSDGTKIPLKYVLLPGYIANRLQGLRANQNAIQRMVFWEDGLRLYARSPIFGNGLASVENLCSSVQSFFYQSKYVHNHYIQVLEEMGIPGLLCFLTLLLSCFILLLGVKRRSPEDKLLPAFGACIAMMALHAMVEVVWSINTYQLFAFAILVACSIAYAEPIPKLSTPKAGWMMAGGLWIFTIVFGLLLYGNVSAQQAYAAYEQGSRDTSLVSMINRDVYSNVTYKLQYVRENAQSNDPQVQERLQKYIKQLRARHEYSVNNVLIEFYYAPNSDLAQIFAASREGLSQVLSMSGTWQAQFHLYESIYNQIAQMGDADLLAQCADQILQSEQYLEQVNADRMEQIVLEDATQEFLQSIHPQ